MIGRSLALASSSCSCQLVVVSYRLLYARTVSVACGISPVGTPILHMSNASEVIALDHAARRGLPHDIADLLFLGGREFVAIHNEFLESGLSAEQDEQQCHALVPSFKPIVLIREGEVGERGDLGVGEGLHKLVPLRCYAPSVYNVQRIEATAAGHGLGGEFEKDALVGRCRGQAMDLEVEKRRRSEYELL